MENGFPNVEDVRNALEVLSLNPQPTTPPRHPVQQAAISAKPGYQAAKQPQRVSVTRRRLFLTQT